MKNCPVRCAAACALSIHITDLSVSTRAFQSLDRRPEQRRSARTSKTTTSRCARGTVRYVESSDGKGRIPAGIQFDNLDFHSKRELRNFVATATQENIFISGS